jgi:hypothetical protein
MIYKALGYKTADNWSAAQLTKKLPKLDTLIEGTELDKKNLKKVNEILRAQAKGRKVIVVDMDDVAADKKRGQSVKAAAKRETKRKAEKKEKTAKKEKTSAKKKVKAKKDAKKQTKRIAEKVDLDKFGSKKGSTNAKINACLSKKPKKMSQLVKEAKISGTCYTHLSSLIKDRVVKKSDKGYALA